LWLIIAQVYSHCKAYSLFASDYATRLH